MIKFTRTGGEVYGEWQDIKHFRLSFTMAPEWQDRTEFADMLIEKCTNEHGIIGIVCHGKVQPDLEFDTKENEIAFYLRYE